MINKKLLAFNLILFIFIGLNFGIAAETVAAQNSSNEITSIEQKIRDYEQRINNLRTTGRSLLNEIEYADSQVGLTELRIQQSLNQIIQKENEIEKLGGDIDNLQNRMDRLQDSIGHQEKVLAERLRTRYKSREHSTLVVLLGASSVNTLIQKAEYLRVLENQDRKIISDMNQTKNAYGLQKTQFEDKKEQEETLKSQLEQEKVNLESYRTQLANQKAIKQQLLVQTQNDEQRFQRLLSEAQRELNQIIGAASVLRNQAPRYVTKGELIGIQGNTGYSFGDHLHFGVYKYKSINDIVGWNWYYSNYVDPGTMLQNRSVTWRTGCSAAGTRSTGSGSWAWPMTSPTISQGFGQTCWSSVYYGGNPHPAYDMWGAVGSPIYAVEEGMAYFCHNCLGDGGNGVFIFHPNGHMTLYWHLR